MPNNGNPEVSELVNSENNPNQQVEQTREETIYNTTHGSDRGTWRDEDMKFTNRDEPGARLHFTPNQIEEARKEMGGDLHVEKDNAHQEALDSNTKANEGFKPLSPASEGKTKFFEQADNTPKDPLDLIPQEPLVDYTKMVDVKEPVIEGGSDTNTRRMIYPFGEEKIRYGFNELKDALENRKLQLFNGDVYLTYLSGKKDEQGNPKSKSPIILTNEQFNSIQKAIAHQDALDSNDKANEGFKPLSPASHGKIRFFEEGDKFKEQLQRIIAHQEALDSNTKANEGYVGLTESGSQALADIDLITDDLLGKNFKNSLSELMDENTAKKYLSFLSSDEVTPPVVTPEQIDIDNRLGDINTKLVEMNTHLSELDTNIQALLQGQEVAQLTHEQLLEYVKLIQEQSKLQFNLSETNRERDKISMQGALDLILTKLNSSTEPPIVEPPVVEPPVVEPPVVEPPVVEPPVVEPPVVEPLINIPTPVVAQGDRVAELEDQLRELRGENTPEQKSIALAKELALFEEKRLNGGGLTDAEKIIYFDLQFQKNEIDRQLNILQQESERKRKNKEKWIKIAAGVAGFGVALATPAIGVAAVVGVTLGGRMVGKGLQSLGNKLRSKSNAIRYQPRDGRSLIELNELDKRERRNQWWANRLGEAGALLIGGATGYGIGTLFEGIVGKDFYVGMNNQPTPEVPTMPESKPETPNETPSTPQPEAPVNPQPEAAGGFDQPLAENWMPGDTFNASDFGWNSNEMGWLGDKVYLTNAGGNSGMLQGDFFRELARLVPKDQLIGQNSGNIVNQFLRAAYGGMNPTEAASKAAELLLAN